MVFARRVFMFAGVYGLIVLIPQFLFEAKIGRDFPPAIAHAEYFYGFLGVAVAWQIAYLIIARDPLRFRPLMLAAIVEKAGFAIPIVVLFALGRVNATMLVAGTADLLFGVLFAVAYGKSGIK